VLFGLTKLRRKVVPLRAVRGKAPATPTSAPSASSRALGDRLRAVATTKTPDEAMALALQIIREEFGAMAVAFCLFEPRYRTLRLAAEIGLSDEGCNHLRTARDGVPVGWDMPLHSLLNRRAYLIDTAARNRYVPPLVEHPASIGTLACIPVEAETRPVGSLILITRAPRRLDERDVLALRPARRALALLTHDLRQRAGDTWAASLAS